METSAVPRSPLTATRGAKIAIGPRPLLRRIRALQGDSRHFRSYSAQSLARLRTDQGSGTALGRLDVTS